MHIVGIEHRDTDGSLQVDLVDGQSKGVDDEVVELHVIPAWLDDLEVLPLFDAEQAPDNEVMIAVHCLCSFIDRLALLEYLMSFEILLRIKHTKFKVVVRIKPFLWLKVADEE